MTAASSEQLAAIAQRARVRSLATVPTRGRYMSTFANGAITGGATWMYSRPDGRVFMVRVSPRRVWLDLQAAMGAALNRPIRVDAMVGPETVAALEAFTRSPAGTPLVAMLAAALLRVYHSGQGSLIVPMPAELPDPRRPVEVRGDTGHHSLIDLTGSTDTAAVTIPRATTAAALREEYDAEFKRAERLIAMAPPAPPRTPVSSPPRPAAPAPAPAPARPAAPAPVAPAPAPPPLAQPDQDLVPRPQQPLQVPVTSPIPAPPAPPAPSPPAPRPNTAFRSLAVVTVAAALSVAIGYAVWKADTSSARSLSAAPYAATIPTTRANPSHRPRRRRR